MPDALTAALAAVWLLYVTVCWAESAAVEPQPEAFLTLASVCQLQKPAQRLSQRSLLA